MDPAAAFVFRKAANELQYNGYSVPRDSTIVWNLIQGTKSNELYEKPER